MLDPTILYECGPEGGSVAGQVEYNEEEGVVTWFNPGGRQRAYDVAAVIGEEGTNGFAFRDGQGRKFLLQPLTVEAYNERIRQQGQPRYPTLQALVIAYWRSLGWDGPPPA